MSVAEEDLAPRLRLSIQRLSRRISQRARGGLTASQLSMLVTVEQHGPIRLGDLAVAEDVAPPTVTRLLEVLAEGDLVERREDPCDRRSALVVITKAGTKLLSQSRHEANVLLRGALDEVSEEQIERLRAALPVLEQLASGSLRHGQHAGR